MTELTWKHIRHNKINQKRNSFVHISCIEKDHFLSSHQMQFMRNSSTNINWNTKITNSTWFTIARLWDVLSANRLTQTEHHYCTDRYKETALAILFHFFSVKFLSWPTKRKYINIHLSAIVKVAYWRCPTHINECNIVVSAILPSHSGWKIIWKSTF